MRNLHDNEDRTDYDAWDSSSENGVRDDGKRLVDDHVGKDQRDEQKMTILTNWFNLSSILLLLSKEE